MNKYKKIAYFIPIPFKDTGNITKYFIEKSELFFLYLYPPSYRNQPSKIEVYKNGKLIKSESIWIYKGENKLLIHFFYIFFYLYFCFKYKFYNTVILFYFPLFLFLSSFLSFFLKNTYIFWIWDYFPVNIGSIKIYNKIVSYYNKHIKYVIYLSPTLRNVYGLNFKNNLFRKTISFGIRDVKIIRKPIKNLIGYIGNLRQGQGLEFLLRIVRNNKQLKIQLIGEGELRKELEFYVRKFKLSSRVIFLGFVNNEKLINIVNKWEVAVAPYDMGKENPTYYTDAGKIKLYVEFEIPIIMTKLSYFYKQIVKYSAGIGINLTEQSFLLGLLEIRKNYKKYSKGVLKLKSENEYNKYYDKKFKFLKEI